MATNKYGHLKGGQIEGITPLLLLLLHDWLS